jgi:glucose-6-phosphate-specific signal transduction histidine kinase
MVLTIVDNGQGFEPAVVANGDVRGLGLGVFGMAERTSLVGGNLRVERAKPAGVRVIATVPIARVHKILDLPPVTGAGRQFRNQERSHD